MERGSVAEAHASHHGRCDPLGIEHRLGGGDIIRQVILVPAAKPPPIAPPPGASPLAGIAIYFPLPVPVGVPRPLVLAMFDAVMFALPFLLERPVAAPLIRIKRRGANENAAGQDRPASHPLRMFPPEVAPCSARPPNHREDGRPLRLLGAVPSDLIGAAAARRGGIGMLAPFVPPRSDTVRPPQWQ